MVLLIGCGFDPVWTIPWRVELDEPYGCFQLWIFSDSLVENLLPRKSNRDQNKSSWTKETLREKAYFCSFGVRLNMIITNPTDSKDHLTQLRTEPQVKTKQGCNSWHLNIMEDYLRVFLLYHKPLLHAQAPIAKHRVTFVPPQHDDTCSWPPFLCCSGLETSYLWVNAIFLSYLLPSGEYFQLR